MQIDFGRVLQLKHVGGNCMTSTSLLGPVEDQCSALGVRYLAERGLCGVAVRHIVWCCFVYELASYAK